MSVLVTLGWKHLWERQVEMSNGQFPNMGVEHLPPASLGFIRVLPSFPPTFSPQVLMGLWILKNDESSRPFLQENTYGHV